MPRTVPVSPRVILGIPSFNHARECREAVESLLAQTYRDFCLVIVDDCSTDGTAEILRDYAATDPRVIYRRNDRRLGMIGNWRRAYQIGLDRWPTAEYFAWASDHDVWHPRWLSRLVSELDAEPDAVLAYPLTSRIDPEGRPTDKRPWRFETRREPSQDTRFRLALQHMSAGNMVYGLTRAREVRACGVFRRVLVPDRLLIMELALRGRFVQVPEVLWYRRWYGNIFSLGRQRSAFFPEGRPLYALVPWWISHAGVLAWRYAITATQSPGISRFRGARYAASYLVLAGLLHARQELKQVRLDLQNNHRIQQVKSSQLAGYLQSLQRVVGASSRRRLANGVVRRFRQTTRNLGLGAEARGRRRHLLAKTAKRVRDAWHNAVRRAYSRASRALLAPFYWLIEGIFASGWLRRFVKRHIVPRILTKLSLWDAPTEEGLATRKAINKMSRNARPIIIGPWMDDPALELLYWIPFLQWAKRYRRLNAERLIVVSRGGVSDWYAGLSGRYVELFDFCSVEEFRRLQGEVDTRQRQRRIKEFSRQAVSMVQTSLSIQDADVLQPSLMYRLFERYWKNQASVNAVEEYAQFRLLPPCASGAPPEGLPENYVAVRFTFTPAFPDTPANRQFVSALVAALSLHTDVVVLEPNESPGWEGATVSATGLARVHTVGQSVSPRDTLGIQTKVIASAQAVIGTYDGVVHLAPLLGVGAVAVFSDSDGVDLQHLQLATRIFARLCPGKFSVVSSQSLDVIRLAATPGVTARTAG